MFRFMKKRKAPLKKAPAKKRPVKKAVSKTMKAAALRVSPKAVAVQWGSGPWAAPATVKAVIPVVSSESSRPALEDVFNHQVKRRYAPLQRLRPPGMSKVRAVLILLAIFVWLVAVVIHLL